LILIFLIATVTAFCAGVILMRGIAHATISKLWKAYWEALTLSGYEQGYKDGYKASEASERVAEERDMESPRDGTNGANGTQAIGPVAEGSPQKGTLSL
jgi:hypothetical protein